MTLYPLLEESSNSSSNKNPAGMFILQKWGPCFLAKQHFALPQSIYITEEYTSYFGKHLSHYAIGYTGWSVTIANLLMSYSVGEIQEEFEANGPCFTNLAGSQLS